MTQQKPPKLYWKEALRHIEVKPNEKTTPVRQRRWSTAYRQALADLEDPGAIVWLPDEIAEVIRQTHPTPETAPPQTRRRGLTTLLLTVLLLLPLAISYLLAYRRIAAHLR